MAGAYDLGSNVPFTANMVNLNDCKGIRFVINFNSEAMENSKSLFPSPIKFR